MVLSILFGELGKISTANVVDLESVIEEVIVFWNIVTYRRDTFSLHSEVFIFGIYTYVWVCSDYFCMSRLHEFHF